MPESLIMYICLMLPLDRFFSFIQHHRLFDNGDKILLTVSGGRDSVFMAHLFHAADISFGIAHCNFKLRAAESDMDEQFVRKLAQELNVPCYVKNFDTAGLAQQKNISIQMAARELRYDWFEHLRHEHGYAYLATAHHQGDSTETMLLNMTRGTGVAGMHGILPRREQIIRPLLFINRQEIDALIEQNHIEYREDSSNASVKYARNKIRLKVIPQLKIINPSLDATFAENAERFAQIEELLELRVAELRETLFKYLDRESFSIDIDALKSLRPQKLLIYELFKPFGFSSTVINDLINTWDGISGRVFKSEEYVITIDRKKLILTPAVPPDALEYDIAQSDADFLSPLADFRIMSSDIGDLSISKNIKFAYFDASLLQFPLKLRLWKKGDSFQPFGMKGRKKLSDFFISRKLPLPEKARTPVLLNANGDIIWVVGMRSDERYKLNDKTRKVLIFELIKT